MDAIAKQLSVADTFCFLLPIIRPFLLSDLVHINEGNLLECLKPPVRLVNLAALT